jgi:tetratricopeptide (TPR) repeat protein
MATLAPQPALADIASSAIARCNRIELLIDSEQPAAIAFTVTLAERAIEQAPNDARSHYAMFCGLAKQVRRAGMSIHVLGDVRRMRKAIDRALELDPTYPEATAAKGAFVYYLPRLLGGSVKGGIKLLERSIELDPSKPATRLLFADLLADRGEHSASVRESQRAVELMQNGSDENERAAACAVVDICADKRWSKEARRAVSGAC